VLHSIGFLHMDLKPDNILLRSGDLENARSSRVELIDFGLSQAYLNKDGSHVSQRQSGLFVGNMTYSSAAQMAGFGKLKF